MSGYKSRKNLRKSKKKSKTGGRRRKYTVKKVRRRKSRKVMRGGEPSPKLTLGEIFALLGEKNPEALDTFKTLFSKDYRKTVSFPHYPNTEFYDDANLENNPSLKELALNQYSSSPPYTYKVDDIIRKFPIIRKGDFGYDDIVKSKIYEGTLTTTLAPEKLENVKKIFKQYQEDTPYSNDVILRILEMLEQKGVSTLRDSLLATVQETAGLPKDCFVVTPEPSKYVSLPKPVFSKDKLLNLLNTTEGLNKIFTDAIKMARFEESVKWREPSNQTLGMIITYI